MPLCAFSGVFFHKEQILFYAISPKLTAKIRVNLRATKIALADLADQRRKVFNGLKAWIIRKNILKIAHISK
jgi:hypothetical protein